MFAVKMCAEFMLLMHSDKPIRRDSCDSVYPYRQTSKQTTGGWCKWCVVRCGQIKEFNLSSLNDFDNFDTFASRLSTPRHFDSKIKDNKITKHNICQFLVITSGINGRIIELETFHMSAYVLVAVRSGWAW